MSTIVQIWAIIRKEIYQRRWALFGFSMAAIGFLLLYILIYPSFQNESAKFDELLKSYPKALLEAFNIEQLKLSTLEGYISVEHFSFVWPLMAIFLSLSLAAVAFAGEVDKGTMAFLLSQPIGRAKIFISKYLSGILAIAGFVVLSIMAMIPLAHIQNLSVNTGNVGKTAVMSFCFAWTIYSLGVLISSFTSERSKSYFVVGGLLLLMYVANIVSGLVKSLETLKYFSFFNYYTPADILTEGTLKISSFIVFVAIAVVSSIIGYVLFLRRDMSV